MENRGILNSRLNRNRQAKYLVETDPSGKPEEINRDEAERTAKDRVKARVFDQSIASI